MDEKRNRQSRILQTMRENKRALTFAALGVLAVIVVILLIVMGVRGGSKTPQSENTDTAVTVAAGEAGSTTIHSGFPLSFSGGGILDVKDADSGLYVLSKDALSFVSTSGAYRTPAVHSYVEPVLKAGGSYALIFDRITGKFQLTDVRRTLISGQSENGQQISTAAVHEKGDFVIAAKGGSYASLLTYYNKKGEILFSWECAKEYIVSVAVADNRKDILCAAVNASTKTGELFTKLYWLNINKTETVWETKISGVAATECAFAGGYDVLMVCGDRRVLIDTKKKQNAEDVATYPSALLCHSDNAGNTAIVNQKLGTFDVYEISLFDKHNHAALQTETDGKPLDVFCRGKRVYLLTDTGVFRVRRSGKLREICRLEETERGFVMVGSDAFHYGKTTLYKN